MTTHDNGDWRHRAACRDEDPELFFPVSEQGPGARQVAAAKAVCARCPVASACLAWALETGQDNGVWGGVSEAERRTLQRRKTRSSSNPAPGPVSDPEPAPTWAAGLSQQAMARAGTASRYNRGTRRRPTMGVSR